MCTCALENDPLANIREKSLSKWLCWPGFSRLWGDGGGRASGGLMPSNDDKLLTFIRGGSSHSLQQETLQHLRYLFTVWYLTDIFLVARCFLCLKGPGRLFPNLCKTPNKEPAMNATCRNNWSWGIGPGSIQKSFWLEIWNLEQLDRFAQITYKPLIDWNII